MPSRARPRQERAVSQEGTAQAGDVLAKFREALPDIAEKMVEDAKTSVGAREKILDIMQDDIARSRAGRATEMFRRLEAVRSSGSRILESLWLQVYRDGPPPRTDLRI